MEDPKDKSKRKIVKSNFQSSKFPENTHLGSSNAFTETENPLSKDADDISDEKLDELLEDD
jgi:hypothetical protein